MPTTGAKNLNRWAKIAPLGAVSGKLDCVGHGLSDYVLSWVLRSLPIVGPETILFPEWACLQASIGIARRTLPTRNLKRRLMKLSRKKTIAQLVTQNGLHE